MGVSAPGSQFLNNGLTSGDSQAGRSPLQGGPQESGSWHAHLPSLQPHSPTAPGQDWASGSVPEASQQAWQYPPARGCLGGWRGALQTESTRQVFRVTPDQDSGGRKGAGICGRRCAWHFSRLGGVSFLSCPRQPGQETKQRTQDQGLETGCYSPDLARAGR